MDVVVIGLGAMGSGIARALLHSSSTTQVSGVDVRFEASAMFMNDAINAKKASTKNTTPFIRPSDAISYSTDVVVLVLTNADQCRAVCLGSSNDSSREKAGDKGSTDDSDEDVGIISLMKPGSVVMMCSTVPPSFVREIASHFAKRNGELLCKLLSFSLLLLLPFSTFYYFQYLIEKHVYFPLQWLILL